MKTQHFGLYVIVLRRACSAVERADLQLCLEFAIRDFKEKRENGEDKDSPKNLSLEGDGKDIWIKGEVNGHEAYGVKNEEESQKRGYAVYDYERRYDAGPKDLAYFEAKDRNYLRRIRGENDDSGELRKLEPDVWYLRKFEGAQDTDIGDWWSQKLKLSNIGELLEKAETLYMYRCLYTFWPEAPKEICQLIAEDFVTGKKLGGLIDEKSMSHEQPQTPMSKVL
jgi:hypothetical protein